MQATNKRRKTPTLSFPVDLQCSYMVRLLLSNLKVSCFCIISTFIFPRVSLERETEKAKLLFLLSFKYQMINRSVENFVFLVPDADHNYILLIMTFDVKYLQSIVKWIDFK